MDPRNLKRGDRIEHPDFGEGEHVALDAGNWLHAINWDRQGFDAWHPYDKRWEQVLLVEASV